MNRLIAALIVLGAVAPVAHADTDPLVQAKRILAKYEASEPTVLEVQRAASQYAQVNPGAYEGWETQARLAYLLPRTLDGKLQSTGTDKKDVRTTNASAGTLSDLVSNDDQLRLELRAQWDLTRLIYNKDAIAAVRQTERLVNQREDILTTVNKLFYARRQLQVEMDLEPPTNVQKALRTQLRIDGLTADLDALTGGWFSKSIERMRTGE